jgi:nitric oxide reductase subunit B
MVWDTFRHVKERKLEVKDRVVWVLAIGGVIYHFVGAGFWGFIHTLPQINYYTHGSQVTVSHGHLAFFGAYALLNLTVFYYALPKLRGIENFRQALGIWAFWITSVAMLVLGLAFGVAGVLQTYLERILGLGYMPAQAQMQFWFKVAIASGLAFFLGVALFIYDLLGMRPLRASKDQTR